MSLEIRLFCLIRGFVGERDAYVAEHGLWVFTTLLTLMCRSVL